MVGGLMFLASYGYFEGGAIGNVLNVWGQAGVFSYAIPFLLIFALLFGILSRMNLFKENKAINGIIALAVALMALQFPFVPLFFAEVFPALGVGLAVMLVILILTGLFIDPKKKGWMMGLSIVSMVVVAAVLISSSLNLGLSFGGWFMYNWPTLIGIGVFVLLIIIIVAASKPKTEFKSDSLLAQAILGDR